MNPNPEQGFHSLFWFGATLKAEKGHFGATLANSERATGQISKILKGHGPPIKIFKIKLLTPHTHTTHQNYPDLAHYE